MADDGLDELESGAAVSPAAKKGGIGGLFPAL